MTGHLKAVGSPLLAHVPAPTRPSTVTLAVPKVIGATVWLLLLSCVSGYAIWFLFADDATLARNFGFGAGVVAFSFAFIASLKPQLSTWLAPLYAVAGGLFMGGLAFAFEARYPGIALQTVLATACVFVVMLALYLAGWLRATPRFRLAVYVATAGIALAYLVAIVLSLLGMPVGWLREGSWGAVLWFGFVSLTAALNLVLDFERIDNLRRQPQPDYINWYVAMGLMVTLVWLYISILRLIANLRR
ncbi:Bax inhibitor-1/YccA family protein [Orrella daihaiensis]|uniref:Bax inhibitor-1/YccA family protein n=1 Tax=Orrella daihaiensis TaxID=2782176 RepID=A0ABY4AN29_9BURK|nr:Bax inhibitor-1/YccA family protein [Orrella daihaiensis]UOD51443.1 Bax inhibitor-1/YccA family protein [Orrella daihaiensis]